MYRPIKWLWGLLPLALLVYAAINYKAASVEADLVQRASREVAQAGQPWARVAVTGRDGAIIGQAPTEERRLLAIRTADSTKGVRLVKDAASILESVKPYTWSAERKADGLILSGYVPSGEAKSQILDMAGKMLPNLKINDQTQLAAGAPSDVVLMGAAGFGFSQLARLVEGKASLVDTALSLTGKSATLGDYNKLQDVMALLPAGVTASGLNVMPPSVSPYILGVNHGTGTVTLTGYVPSEDVRKALIDRIKAQFSGVDIVDNMRLASGQSDNWLPSAEFALTQLRTLKSGRFTLEDGRLNLIGDANTVADKQAVLASLAKLPVGISGHSVSLTAPEPVNVDVPTPPEPQIVDLSGVRHKQVAPSVPDVALPMAPTPDLTALQKAAQSCQSGILDLMKGKTILFFSSRVEIKLESYELLNQIAQSLAACSEAKIEIIGHTDTIGSPDVNQIISEERAQSVMDYLERRGVMRTRMSTSGRGEASPVATNETVEGRMQNRRIEFIVK